MNAADRRGVGVNLGFIAALSPFRHWVMGNEAMARAATDVETARIRALLRESVTAGAFGFSLTVMPQHLGYQGNPLASHDELRAYFLGPARVRSSCDRDRINQAALCGLRRGIRPARSALVNQRLSGDVAQLAHRDDAPDAWPKTLTRVAPLLARGCVPQVAARPLVIEFHLRNRFFLQA
jgi:N-acyl-D-amino-acid deacylase